MMLQQRCRHTVWRRLGRYPTAEEYRAMLRARGLSREEFIAVMAFAGEVLESWARKCDY